MTDHIAEVSNNRRSVSRYDPGMHSHRFTHPWLLTLVVTALAMVGLNPPSAQGEDQRPEHLIAASGADHLWFVSDAIQLHDRKVLCHHARAMRGPYFSRAMPLSQHPEQMAAVGRQAWLVFPAQEVDDLHRRDVYTLQIEYDEAIDMYRPSPRDQLRLVEALPGEGHLAGLVGTHEGPVALLLPDDDDREDEAGSEAARLLLLRSNRWTELQLPQGFAPSNPTRVGVAGTNLDRLHLFTADPDDPQRTVQFIRDAEGEWREHQLTLDLRQVLTLATADGRLAVVMTDENNGYSSIRLAYIRPGVLLPFAQVPAPSEPWTVLGMKDGFRIINASGPSALAMQHIDPVTGAAGPHHAMRDQPLPAGRLWHMALMLAIAVIAVLIVLLVRPTAQEQVKLPDDLVPASAGMRGMALLIDLIPGALAAVFILRAPPNVLIHLPILTTSFGDAAPHLLMIGVAIIHGTMTELVARTTLGKSLLGIRITNAEGDAPAPAQILLRNVLKGMILLIPPLAVFMLLNPYMQGVNDLLARTFVVQSKPVEAEEPSGSKDGNSS